jgi:methylthioribose-1-phosphate isomerase
MKVQGKEMRTIWVAEDGWSVQIIDQRQLPHRLEFQRLETLQEVARAIAEMWVRGAPLIGVTAAYGVALAMRSDSSDSALEHAHETLLATRPTAVNLRWALDAMRATIGALPPEERVPAAYAKAAAITEDDVECSSRIGDHGLQLIRKLADEKKGPLGILTHCNAGWLATIDWGTALAPIYKAHDAGIEVVVYVDETRPRNQGAALSAWELGQHGVPHKVIVDNAGGHLMQHGMIDLCIVGSDRTTARGDVCNKIGTYLKALAARDNDIPFYAALPHSTIDWSLSDGLAEIPIEERSEREVTHIRGFTEKQEWAELALTPPGTEALNFGFDVTPARLVTGIITERGVAEASAEGLARFYQERPLRGDS